MTQAPASDTFSFDRYQERKDILSLMQKSVEYSFNVIGYHGEESAEITGYEGTSAFLRIPGELGGFPVRSIGRRAFSDRAETEELVLPDNVRRIGDFAFYGCPKLKILDLSDGTEEIGDGVIRSCGSLREIRIRMQRGQFRAAKDLLADCDAAVRILFSLPDGEALLYFPAYLNDFDEDTMARAIHPRIEGCGYAFREAVTRKGIDLYHYDRQFPRTEGDGWKVIGEVALARIFRPYRLSEEARQRYEAALLRISEDFLPYLVKEDRKEETACLAANRLLKQEAVPAALREASARRDAELCGILMEYGRDSRKAVGGSAFIL